MTFTPGSLLGMFVSLTGSGGPSAGSGTSQNLGNGLTAGLLYDDSTGNIELEYVATPTTTADTWTAGDTGDWTTAAQWSNGAPTFYTDATIGANATVTLATDATVNSLTLDAGAALTTGTGDGLSTVFLTVDANAALTVNGEMTVDESTTSVLNNGAIEIAGPMLDINANVTGSGSFQIDPGATLEFEHLVEPTAVSFNGPGGTLFVNTNPQLFSGTLVGFNTGGVLEVAEIITGVTVDHVNGSEQNLVLSGNTGLYRNDRVESARRLYQHEFPDHGQRQHIDDPGADARGDRGDRSAVDRRSRRGAVRRADPDHERGGDGHRHADPDAERWRHGDL